MLPPVYAWTKTWGGSGDESAGKVVVDKSGNVYVAGAFAGTVDFDPDPVKTDIHSSHNGTIDAYLAKFSPDGTFLWARTWGGGPVGGTGFSGRDIAGGLALDSHGNVYVCGHFQYTVDFNPAGGTTLSSNAGSMNNPFLSKFTPDGTFLWARAWGPSDGGSEGYSVAVDASDNAYVVGDFTGTSCDFNPWSSPHDVHVNHGFFDAYLTKFDSNGTFQWAKTWGGEGYDDGPGVAVDSAGNVYVAGMYASTNIDFDPAGGAGTGHPAHDSGAVVDVFLSKFDSNGNFKWVRTWGGASTNEAGGGLVVDGTGAAYVTGRFECTNCDFNPLGAPDLHSSVGGADSFVAKYDANGNFQWARTWGGSGADCVGGIVLDEANNVYAIGGFTGTTNFDQGRGTANATSNGGQDVFLVAFDSGGAFQQVKTWGGSGADWGWHVGRSSGGRLYVAGEFETSVDFDPGSGVDSRAASGGTDAFLGMFTPAAPPVVPPTISVATLSPGAGGVSYSQALTATGGTGPLTWALVGGTLAPGLALSPQGALSGKPLVAGVYPFRVRVTGADGGFSEADLSLTIGAFRRYFAEGASSGFFDCYFALANPSETTTANVTLTFLRYDSLSYAESVEVPPLTRRTVDVKSVPGMWLAPGFATVVESNVEVVADRTMSWDQHRYGSHAETSIQNPAQTWYLAEGATQNGFQLYYSIENPNADPVDVTVTYLRRAPNPAFDITYAGIPGNSRRTVYVNGEDARLSSCDVSAVVTSITPNRPIIVERSMYLRGATATFTAGHSSAGVTAAATDWFLAEGATVGTFDMFIVLANPGEADGTASITYMLTNGRTMTKAYAVAARSRQTVWVNGERDDLDASLSLAHVSLSARVQSTVPIIVERSMWWSAAPGGPWIEAHNAVGTTETGTWWAAADGEQGGGRNTQTYVLVANTSLFPGRVRVTVLGEDGSTSSTERDVPASSRSTFWMGGTFVTADSPFGATLDGRRFAVIVESVPTEQGTIAIVVERAMYSDSGGVPWAAGTDVVATRLK
jgi:hypothetical protein